MAEQTAYIVTPEQFERGLEQWAARRLAAELVKVPEYVQFDLDLPSITFVSVPAGDLPPLRVTLTITATAYAISAPDQEEAP